MFCLNDVNADLWAQITEFSLFGTDFHGRKHLQCSFVKLPQEYFYDLIYCSTVCRRWSPASLRGWLGVCAWVGGLGWKQDLRFPLLRIMPPLLWLQITDWNWSSQNTCFPLSGLPESSLLFLLPLKRSLQGGFRQRDFYLPVWWKPAPCTELARPSWWQYRHIFFDIRSDYLSW